MERNTCLLPVSGSTLLKGETLGGSEESEVGGFVGLDIVQWCGSKGARQRLLANHRPAEAQLMRAIP